METSVCDSKGSVSEFQLNVFHPAGAANTDVADKAVTCEHSPRKKKRVQPITWANNPDSKNCWSPC